MRVQVRRVVVLVVAVVTMLGAFALPADAATRVSTWQLSTLTSNSASYYVHKGGWLTAGDCHSYSNSAALGAQFGPIKKFVTLNFSVTIVSSYTSCSGASDPVTKAGYYHWHGMAKRWESKIFEGDRCGKGYCVPIYSYPIAQDRWFYKVVSG